MIHNGTSFLAAEVTYVPRSSVPGAVSGHKSTRFP